MTNYTVRVELHDADDGDYDDLHDAMAKKGFVRWVKSSDGEKSQLPTAEYNLPDSNLDRDEVLKMARATADSVKSKPKPWILVTQSAGRTWSGLRAWNG